LKGGMYIYVKTTKGKILTLDAEPCYKIIEIKKKIMDKECIPLNMQTLIFAGK